MSLHPRQPCAQHASAPAQPAPHPRSSGTLRLWGGAQAVAQRAWRARGPHRGRAQRRGTASGSEDSWKDAGWRPGEVAPRESELLPSGCLAAALPAALTGLGEASLWPQQAAPLAGPAMGAREQRRAGLQRRPGPGGATARGRKDPLPQERAVRSSWKHLEAPGAGCSPPPWSGGRE